MTTSTQFLGGGVPLSSPLLSVIVPVYKVEPYLRKALDSLLAQTYTNLEIICVDDGSPDSCPDILDEYAARDSRILVIHQRNQGCAAARNAGLDRATGEFVTFLDPDDYLRPEAYEQAMSYMTDEIDVVQFGFDEIAVGNEVSKEQRAGVYRDYVGTAKMWDSILRIQMDERGISFDGAAAVNTTAIVWDKIFRRSVVEKCHLRFPAGLWGDDGCFQRCYYAVARRMYFLPNHFYVYVIRGGAQLTAQLQKGQDARVMTIFEMLDRVFAFYVRQNAWERLVLLLPWLTYTAGSVQKLLPPDTSDEGLQRVRALNKRWREVIEEQRPWDDRLQHLLGGLHGWASVRHEWRNGWRYPKDRRRIFPGLSEFARPGLRKFFVCGVPVFTIVDVGNRRFFKLFGVKIRKKRIED